MPNLTPGGWLELLDARLRARQPQTRLYEEYYDGQHRLAFATAKFREAFGQLFAAFSDNWCELVVDAAVERLKVEGFRFGGSSANDQAWEVWQANGLDAESTLAHREAVKCGESYVLVDPNGRITVEHPAEAIVATAPGDHRQRLAGLKRWVEIDGYIYAELYLPDEVYRYKSQRKANAYIGSGKVNWQTHQTDPGGRHNLGAVPLVPLCNKPSMTWGGQSDLKSAIPLQDAANKIVSDMLVASEFQAFPQRWAVGLEVPIDPITGQPTKQAQLAASVSRLWIAEGSEDGPDPKFGAFPQLSLEPYVAAVEMLIQHVAAQTRTPPHYLLGQSGAFPSGESLKSTETGLVARVEDKQTTFGEGWEEALRLAFRAKGNTELAEADDAETIWRDPEARTEGEHIDATLKLQSIGVPEELLWERAGFTPQQIKRIKRIKAREAPQGPPTPPATRSTPELILPPGT